MPRKWFALSLFWRTFILLCLLLAAGIASWVQTFQALESGPRAVQSAQQIARLVRLSRVSLHNAEASSRLTLIKTLFEQNAVVIKPRASTDQYTPYEVSRYTQAVGQELRSRLGPSTVLASGVNGWPTAKGRDSLWVSFEVDHDRYWLQTIDSNRMGSPTEGAWLTWVGVAMVVTVLCSVVIAQLINQPLTELSFAASRVREGEYDSVLDESMITREIREVNQGFNRMARELAKVEEDRAVMLAGISHDLRTPLARLRLEAEMSVTDEEAKRNMAADIDQLDAIIDKFMDYARPGAVELIPVHVSSAVNKSISQFRNTQRIRITAKLPIDTKVMADEIELGRVLTNLFENALRYGRRVNTDMANVEVSCMRAGPWVVLSVRDHGPGVAPAKLPQLTTPFFRGDTARTAATGAGLGLAIVDKALQRMGGNFELANAPGGGLVAHIKLKRAP